MGFTKQEANSKKDKRVRVHQEDKVVLPGISGVAHGHVVDAHQVDEEWVVNIRFYSKDDPVDPGDPGVLIENIGKKQYEDLLREV